MRTFGRTLNADGTKTWQVVQTDSAGFDDYVWITTLIQCLQLTPGESPFFANYGIPAQQSIVTQMYPDFYVALLQSQFAQYFASLSIKRISGTITNSSPVKNWGLQTLNNVYKSDWQGRQFQYSTARTNMLTYSQAFDNAAWTKFTGTSALADTNVAPDGTTTAEKLMATATNQPFISRVIPLSLNATYTQSIYLAYQAGSAVQYAFVWMDNGAGFTYTIELNLVTGASRLTWNGGQTTFSNFSFSVTPAANGYWRVQMTGTALVTASVLRVYLAATPWVSGNFGTSVWSSDGVSGASIWGGQFEQSAVATSYIPTITAPVTVTDYSIIGNNIIFANPPLAKAILDWSGTATSNMGDVQNFYQSTFGIGDGVKTSFPLNLPASSGKVPGPEYDIKIVRNNGSIFNQVIAV